ncbi:hypothetical protein [Buttiauxella gaviniae]|uniref:hypothetical protein n=1 Tax=Buttiauxella gaviniae TaxID=82990 RepID=UPI003C71844D
MELIENYQPEYVKRFKENNNKCLCQTCQKEGNGFPFVTLRWKNQQRESLSLSCQTAASEILLNPRAFVLNMSSIAVDSKDLSELEHDVEMLHQIFINHIIDNATDYRESLYAISILLNKVQRCKEITDFNIDQLVTLSSQISELIFSGQLKKHLSEISGFANLRLNLLLGLGDMPLEIDLPMVKKMSFMLKLTELKIFSEDRIEERLLELENVYYSCPQFFLDYDFLFKNLILYKIYNNSFCDLSVKSISFFKTLCEELFQIKMLVSIYLLDNSDMGNKEVSLIINAYYRWKKNDQSNKIKSIQSEDAILYGLAVL